MLSLLTFHKSIFFASACGIIMLPSCSGTMDEPVYQPDNEFQQKAAGENEDRLALLELQADNAELRESNKSLLKKIEEIHKKIETENSDTSEKLRSMEDLISLLETSLEGKPNLPNTFSTERKPLITPLTPTDNLSEPLSNSKTPQKELASKEPFGFFQKDQSQDTDSKNIPPNENNFSDPDLKESKFAYDLKPQVGARAAYAEAYKTFNAKKYIESISQFRQFLKDFPLDQNADNAQFWIGQSYWNIGKTSEAEKTLRKVLKQYKHGKTSHGFKTPDTILMLGKIKAKQNNYEEARYYLESVIKIYPESGSAHKADRELKALSFQTPT